VDYVELDPLVLQVAREFPPASLSDPRIEVISTDGRLFLRETDRRYDVILVDMPDPSTSQINRFYTREFFAEAKRRLTEHGVLAFALGRYENRISGDLARAVAVAHKTLAEQFANVLVVPTSRLRFLASDGPLTTDIAGRLEANRIPVRLLDRHYLAAVLAPDRMADVDRAVGHVSNVPTNRDFSPILYYYHLRYWMRQFDVSFGLLEGVLGLMLLAFLLRLRPVSLAVFSSGFAASALEVVLLMGFQILFGSIYHRVGLIVTMFMLGLAIGALAMNRVLANRGRRDLIVLELAIAVVATCLPAVLIGVGTLASSAAWNVVCQGVICFITLLVAVLTGLVFPLAAKLDFQEMATTASRLYTADYVGAALGALLVSTLLIPLIGVTAVCLAAAALNLLGGAAVWLARAK
jgi:spermidine synthase